MKKSVSKLLIFTILNIVLTTMVSVRGDENVVGETPSAIFISQTDYQKMRARLKAMTSEERQRFVENMKNLSPQQRRDIEQRVREIAEKE